MAYRVVDSSRCTQTVAFARSGHIFVSTDLDTFYTVQEAYNSAMNIFDGHAVAGSLFYLCGVWWAVSCLRRHYISVKERSLYTSTARRHYISVKERSLYTSTAVYSCCVCSPCCGRLSQWPVESGLKVFLLTLGLLAETPDDKPLQKHPIILQHITMYSFFLMSGLVELVLHAGVPLPPGSDYVTLMLAFAAEGLLFSNHLQGRAALDLHLHTLLFYVVLVTVGVILLEVRLTHSPILSLARAYLVMLQGSWLWAQAFILYGHGETNDAKGHIRQGLGSWDWTSHEHVKLASVYFCWHCVGNAILLLLISIIMHFFYRDSSGDRLTYKILGDEMCRPMSIESWLTTGDADSGDGVEIEMEEELSRTSVV